VSATVVGTFEAGSPEWHAARLTGLGGSEVAAVLGLSKWESRFSLWHRKRGEVGPQSEKPEMEWGKRLEPVVLSKFFDEHPELWRMGEGRTYRNDARPWQIANPDELALPYEGRGPAAIVEAKTADDDFEWGPTGSDIIPVYYRCQVQWYMDCLGLKVAHVAVLIRGRDYREYEIPYDPEEARFLRGKAAAFIRSLRHNQRPDIDGHTATYQAVKQLPDGATGETVTIPTEDAEAYQSALAAADLAEAEKRRAAGVVLDHIGDGKFAATNDGQRVAIRAVKADGRTHSLRPCKAPA
jgi:putative phage-type endonuclease